MSSGDGAPSATAASIGRARDDCGLGHRSLTEIQRARMLDAMVRAACEKGAANVTVADVTKGAGVSRRTFYEIFDDSRDCLLAAIEQAVTGARERVLSAYEKAPGGWRGQIRAGLVALLGFFEDQPHVAQLLIVEWLAAGPRGLERRRQVLERIASVVDEGCTAQPGGASAPSPLAAEGVVGAAASVLHARLARSHPAGEPLALPAPSHGGPRTVELVNPLMSMIVLPYLGAAAARKELERPVPVMSLNGSNKRPIEDLLTSLNMRLTYRTMRVLAAAASHPGGSNRTLAQAAGIGDQGQISKLLTRLQKLGLLENNGGKATVKGEPNAWSLTATGRQVERSLRI